MAGTHHRHSKSKMMGRRRHADDEADTRPDLDVDDDSITDGSAVSDNGDDANGSDTSNIDETSPTTPTAKRSTAPSGVSTIVKPITDTDLMLHGISMTTTAGVLEEVDFADVTSATGTICAPTSPAIVADNPATSGPVIVSSSSVVRQDLDQPGERRRREHEEYKRRRDEDPAFVPNRGFFFMHDQRQAGSPANGYRSYGRGRGRGNVRGSLAGPYGNILSQRAPQDPTVSAQWTHDLHDSVAEPLGPRYNPHSRHPARPDVPPHGNGLIPTCPPSATAIDRTMSTQKQLGKVQVRIWLPSVGMASPLTFLGVVVTQYTKLPDHRPPLRRDKAVRISLPNSQPRFIFPSDDRSFIFIPRAMRPNQQQRLRGKPQSRLGSIGGYSRRTSLFGGSYYGSVYSPSIAMSRRSSVIQDPRDVFSPPASVVHRPPESTRPAPIVRLPPTQQGSSTSVPIPVDRPSAPDQSDFTDLVQAQYSLPMKPVQQESQSVISPIHQPRPQKALSVNDIESPTSTQNVPSESLLNINTSHAFQQAFHQQVPVSVASSVNGFPPESMHTRQPSYTASSHGHSTGTPLSQIPERAIHAAPFQPNTSYAPQPPGYAYSHQYGVMQPSQGYYYPPPPYTSTTSTGVGPSVTASTFIPSIPQHTPASYGPPPPQPDIQSITTSGPPGSSLVAQEHNGMVYYFDSSHLASVPAAPMNSYPHPSYPPVGAPHGYAPMPMAVGPMPEGFYYSQHAPHGMVFYTQ